LKSETREVLNISPFAFLINYEKEAKTGCTSAR
jgi:hypothetical protein